MDGRRARHGLRRKLHAEGGSVRLRTILKTRGGKRSRGGREKAAAEVGNGKNGRERRIHGSYNESEEPNGGRFEDATERQRAK